MRDMEMIVWWPLIIVMCG